MVNHEIESDADGVKTFVTDAILEVMIDRPPANAISNATSHRLGDVFTAFRDDPELRVAILSGAGETFFSAGWDLKSVAAGDGMDGDPGVGGFGGIQALPGLNKPVIAAINGMCVGGGFETVLAADLVYAAEHARFMLPEIKIGQVADSGLIRLARRLPRQVVNELLYTGRWMDAAEAKHWGLINDVVPRDQLMPHVRSVAQNIADGAPLCFAAIKDALDHVEQMPFADLLSEIRQLSSMKQVYESDDFLEGPKAFAEKRPAIFRGR
ncbi:MAG: enoyl-CoA hydratase-related protein [Alphaproteobacteria bacterium]